MANAPSTAAGAVRRRASSSAAARAPITVASEPRLEVTIRGDLNPFCRQMFSERLAKYSGDWTKVVDDAPVNQFQDVAS